MQMRVEDDSSPSRKGRRANIQVLSRGAQQQSLAKAPKSQNGAQRKSLKAVKSQLVNKQVSCKSYLF